MSREVEVEYNVRAYAVVDLDEGKVVKVEIAVDGIESTGETRGVNWKPSVAEQIEAHRIAESDAPWPAWEQD